MTGNVEDFCDDLIERIAARCAERMAEHIPQPQSNQAATAAYLTTAQAAKLMCVGQSTLELWRARSKGPAWVKLGTAIRYSRSSLDAWLDTRTRGVK